MAPSMMSLALKPGKGLGFLALGTSLHEVLNRIRTQGRQFPVVDLAYSQNHPLDLPLTITLPENGLRLRFDGPEQRLRLIEVLDFSKSQIAYDKIELVKHGEIQGHDGVSQSSGPSFRHIYHKLLGPTFPGKYMPPRKGGSDSTGMYILSYPGVAFSFHIADASAGKGQKDFVSLLSSPAVGPAASMAIFWGNSWEEARAALFDSPCPHLPCPSLQGSRLTSGKLKQVDEIAICSILDLGRIEISRRVLPPFTIVLGQTTPQDLVAELGPPDAIYQKHDRRLSIHKQRTSQLDSANVPETQRESPNQKHSARQNSYIDNAADCEYFFNYFHHGLDFLISPLAPNHRKDFGPRHNQSGTSPGSRAVATKVLLQGNVPGSYAFNRYQRCRWQLRQEPMKEVEAPLTSESTFGSMREILERISDSDAVDLQQRTASSQTHMVLNRGWGDSPGSSCELLGSWDGEDEEDVTGKPSREPLSLGNTMIYGFPGLLFEVLESDTISCLTVY